MSRDKDTAVVIDPTTYVEIFEGRRQPIPCAISGVCGRVVRSRTNANLEMLAYTAGRRLAWVTGPGGLRAFVGRTGADIVLGIGKKQAWLAEKLAEGMHWKLVVIPQAACTRADWNGVFEMIQSHYQEIAQKLGLWRAAVAKRELVMSIDPTLVTGAVKDNLDHPSHMTVEKYKSCEDTAVNARLFLWHSLGLNEDFTGDGWAANPIGDGRVEEYLTANARLEDVVDVRLISLQVQQDRAEGIRATSSLSR